MNGAHTQIWQECLDVFKDNIETDVFENIFKPIKSVSFADDVLTIEVPTMFFYEYLEEHYLDLLKKTLRRVIGPKARLKYQVKVKNPKAPKSSANSMTLPADFNSVPENKPVDITMSSQNISPFLFPGIKKVPLASNLDKKKNFDNFIVGKCNETAVLAGKQIAENPGKSIYNPLFIHGPSGVGKTHLAHAIGLLSKQNFPDKITLYTNAHEFQTQYTQAVKSKNVEDFIYFYKKIDILIVDDIQDLADKKGTQKVFFTIFDYLAKAKKQIILTADRPPVELLGFNVRLSSRFLSGIILELENPNYETRKKILEKKTEEEGIKVPREVIEYIALKVEKNVRIMEGILMSVMVRSRGTDISLDVAKRVVSNIIKVEKKTIGPELILQYVANYFHISEKAIKAKTRKHEVVVARQIAMYFIKKITNMNLKSIGGIFNKDHATVIHAIKTVSNMCDVDSNFRNMIDDIKRNLN